MSIHRSLKSKNMLTRSRNVLSRTERIEALRKAEKWEEGRSVFGLPSVRAQKPRKKKKELPTEAAAAQEAEAPESGDSE